MKKRASIPLLGVCLIIAMVMQGGFFDHSVAVIGMAVLGSFLYVLLKGESLCRINLRGISAIPAILTGIALLVSFWAVDYMDNLMGVLRLMVVCLWMYLVQCRGREEADAAKKSIPLIGCVSIGISVVSLLNPSLEVYFWENNRLSGFFQYANTNGLFYALGIMILIYQLQAQKKKMCDLIQIGILLMGLLLSGSRSVLLLLLIWGVYYAVKTAEFRKPFFIGTGGFLALGGLYVAVTGNTSNIGRIFSIFTSNSTLWGRLLYYRDAILLLCQKFFGLGRLGYYYSQGTFQSGVYNIKYVHNDFLQVALDYGVIALILLLIYCGWQIFMGKQGKENKELFVFLLVASLVDLHCQYLLIVMVAYLFCDHGEQVKEKNLKKKWRYAVVSGLSIVFLYVGIATGSGRQGDYGLALTMLPDYTSVQEDVMLNSMGSDTSYILANQVLEKNPYNITAHIARGSFYASNLQVQKCIDDFDMMLELAPYNVDYYKQYDGLLQKMKDAILAIGDDAYAEELALIQDRMDSLPDQLEQVKDRTSSLAYMIKDEPVFTY
ncbi:MAG: O-antigen ligase family protein [Roseburia sp.]|nr:O-antigen ligase family protein [Roseburia sp.]